MLTCFWMLFHYELWHISLHAWALVFRCSILYEHTCLFFSVSLAVNCPAFDLHMFFPFMMHPKVLIVWHDIDRGGISRTAFQKTWMANRTCSAIGIHFVLFSAVALAPIIKQAIKQHCHPMSLPLVPPKRCQMASRIVIIYIICICLGIFKSSQVSLEQRNRKHSLDFRPLMTMSWWQKCNSTAHPCTSYIAYIIQFVPGSSHHEDHHSRQAWVPANNTCLT